MPHRGLPDGAWKTLKTVNVQLENCSGFPSSVDGRSFAVLARMGRYHQFSYQNKVKKGVTAFDSLIKTPIDPTEAKLILDLVDVENRRIVGRAKLDLRAASTSGRSSKKFQGVLPVATEWNAPLMLKFGVKMSQTPCNYETPNCKSFTSNPKTTIPNLNKNDLVRESSFKEGRMKLVSVSKKGNRAANRGSPVRGDSTSVFRPKVVACSDSEEDVLNDPMKQSFYQDLSKKEGFGFIAAK
eukprot:GHVH01013066.1.p1 GENE.GHVH01013066.1~~GHVH01013066.1.p1  ORF type:complete len:240 (+),score=29.55 GHVH01013066.1:324-1043(+)